ncbi:MAG: hypothetical protein O3A10_15085 [Chloroflexi bacterium]|nr:hypothetical protein [Chloroflexota bacterium]MDA1145771.1 hypothetical protein [Chloroflexota bacterium]
MTTANRFAENVVTAFLDGPDDPTISNAIHSTQGAKDYGYQAALVGGVTVWGWATPTILESLGERWLDDGWALVRFRRPTYPGDELTVRVDETAEGGHTFRMTKPSGDNALVGELGLGKAPWFDEITEPERRTAEERPAKLPRLTLDLAHSTDQMRPLATPISEADAREYGVEKQRTSDPRFIGAHPLVHPGWIAGRMTRLMHHSFDYGPAIHSSTHVQNLARFESGQTVTSIGRLADAFERKGHHYAVLDAKLIAEDGTELTRIRHTTIFQVAKRGSAD